MTQDDLCGPMGRPMMRGPTLTQRMAALDAARTNRNRPFHYRNVYVDGSVGLPWSCAKVAQAHAECARLAHKVIARVKVFPKV